MNSKKVLKSLGILFLANNIFAVNKQNQPNIIYILADDLGYGDLSCYGQKKFSTPNIDKLAQNGMRFINHYSGSTVSAPTRASLMTGLHTGHCYVRGNSDNILPLTARIFPQMLQDEGYITGMFGKWGLGNYPSSGEPGKHGFNQFVGFTDQGLAHRSYPDKIVYNGENLILTGNDWSNKVAYSPDTIHNRALKYIEENKNNTFFLYYSQTLPHAELIVPDDSIFRKFKGQFTEKPFSGADYIGSATSKSGYCSQDYPLATFASMVTRLDLYVGEIVKKLEELGLTENTIIMFSSDNGPHSEGGANPTFFNSSGGLRGIKRDIYEGGIRAPFIVKWPEKVAANSISDLQSAHWDIFPTIKEMINSSENYVGDGYSLLPTLSNKGEQTKHRYLYWEFYENNGRRGLRWGDWKLVQYTMTANPNASCSLFNLKTDPAEATNIAATNPDIVDKLTNAMEIEHIKADNLNWTYEQNTSLHDVRILVTDDKGNPINNVKVVLQNTGNRITWEEGMAIYRGVVNGSYNLTVSVNGIQMTSSQLEVNSSDISTTVVITNTDIAETYESSKIIASCFYDKTLNSLRVKSSHLLSKYKIFDCKGKTIKKGDCYGTFFNIELAIQYSKMYIIEFETTNGQSVIVKGV